MKKLFNACNTPAIFIFTLMYASLHSQIASADSLTNLKTYLSNIHNTTPVKAKIEASFERVRDGKKGRGEMSVVIEQNETAFKLSYPQSVITEIQSDKALKRAQQVQDDIKDEIEAEKKDKNEKDKTVRSSTHDAVRNNNAIDLYRHITISENLLTLLINAELIDEAQVELDGKQTTRLNVKLPLAALMPDKKFRSYVKKFEASYFVWLDSSGNPIKSEMKYNGSGRAYLIISMEAHGEFSETYQRVGDRLVMLTHQSKNGADSIFGKFEYGESSNLILLSN